MEDNKSMSDTCSMPLPQEAILIGARDDTINGVEKKMAKKLKKESHKHTSRVRDISIDIPPEDEYPVKLKIVKMVDET